MPGGNKNIRGSDNTNGFQVNPQNIGKGRKKKIYTILKEKGYSADDIKTAFGELAFYTLKELQDVFKDESKPVITRIVANQFYQAMKKSDWNKVRDILEHVIGKPNQNIFNTNATIKIESSDKSINKDLDKMLDV